MGIKSKLVRGIYIYKKRGIRGLMDSTYDKITKKYSQHDTASLPDTASIEISRICNLNCKMCWRQKIKRDDKYLKFENFKKIYQKLDFISKISFIGLGEPLLNPDFFKIANFCSRRGVMVDFTTNATLVNEKVAKKILNLNSINNICFSFDAFSPDIYEKIRVGAKYDKVKRNIERFSELASGNSPSISIGIVGMKTNIEELKDIVQFANNIKATGIFVEQAHACSKEIANQNLLLDHKEEAENIKRFIRKNNMNYNITWDTPVMRRCVYPWKQPYIQINGDVKACCFLGVTYSKFNEWYGNKKMAINPSEYIMGNIFDDNFEDIWNGSKYRLLRKYVGNLYNGKIDLKKYADKRKKFSDKFPDYCRVCQYRHRLGC